MTQRTDLFEQTADGRLRMNFHTGQWRAWQSTARIVAVLAGTQGGKTCFGPPWLYREIQRAGPGDYMVVAPTFPLLSLKALPEFLRLFKRRLRLGEYTGSPVRKFTFSADGAARTFGFVPETETCVYFGHAQDPDSLESATAKRVWCDEAGQKKFRLGSFHALQRRLSIHEGRMLITTTPYDLGWLKQQIWDPWHAGDTSIEVVRFDSTENPAFPVAEFERARRSLPAWKFDLFYRAIFTRPAGLIYDCFDEGAHLCPRYPIGDKWRRFLGLDFGGVNTVGVFFAQEPGTGRLYAYREYRAGGRTAREHARHLLAGEPGIPYCVGGSKSEGQWRDEFTAAGLPVREPEISDVEVGITRVYGAIKRDEVMVFSDLAGLRAELGSYSRVLDERGEPTKDIEDKSDYHHLDAVRYILGYLKPDIVAGTIGTARPGTPGRSIVSEAPEGVFADGWR